MKHKLTVLACVGMALLLSTGFAFAQNTITVESKDVDRCATTTVNVTLDNADGVGAIGLPLLVTGGTLNSVTAGPALAGWNVAINQSGNQVIVNGLGSCLAGGSGPYSILTLEIETPEDCSGDVIVDLDPAPAVPATLVLGGCDCCELPASFVPGTLTLVNNPPVCGTNSDENLDWKSEIVDKQLFASDPDACDDLTYTLVSGPGSITGDLFSWDPECADVGDHTVTFEVADDCGATVECSFDITVTQEGPVCDAVAPQSVHWLDHLSTPLPATDDGCPDPLTWTLDSDGGLGGTLSVAGGSLEYDPVCADVGGTYLVEYTVSDGAKTCSESVEVTVTNDAPTAQCSDVVGDLIPGTLIENDVIGDDLIGDPLTYSIVSFTHSGVGPGDPNNQPQVDASGHVTWQTEPQNNNDLGIWTLCVEVSDGCAVDTCCFDINVVFNFTLCIGGAPGVDSTVPSFVVDTIPTLPGEIACAYINIHDGYALGGFDLLIGYDQSGLSPVSIMRLDGTLDESQTETGLRAWEYFTYRFSANSNCSGGCPSGLIRLVAIADMDNGPGVHPDSTDFLLDGYIAKICFRVTSDWNFLGQCLPIDFYSIDCGDNTLSSKTGDTLFTTQGVAEECIDTTKGHEAVPIVDLCGGSICIREPVDARGDLNLNFIANEVGDAVLYSRYFIDGISALNPVDSIRAVQIQASDVNNDGVELTVADLIYLIRVITGDAQPFPDDNGMPKIAPYANSADVVTDTRNGRLSITTDATVELGGAVLTFRYSDVAFDKAQTTEASEGMVVSSKASRGEFRVLMAPEYENLTAIQSGRNEILSIPYEGDGTIELVNVQLSDAEGMLLSTDHQNLAKLVPQSYSLLQNYPNPFNAGTVIRFDLKDASDWNLTIYNITGQVVRTFSGHNEASRVNVQWDGLDNNGNSTASGVYLYKVTAGDFTSSKKMTLIK